MSESDSIKEYLKRLQKIINFEAVFAFGNYRLLKKSRVDDIICCIYATLPDSYKKILKARTDVQRYNSVICYNMLTKLLAKPFFLDKGCCLVKVADMQKLIVSINNSIERDINAIEELYDE